MCSVFDMIKLIHVFKLSKVICTYGSEADASDVSCLFLQVSLFFYLSEQQWDSSFCIIIAVLHWIFLWSLKVYRKQHFHAVGESIRYKSKIGLSAYRESDLL